MPNICIKYEEKKPKDQCNTDTLYPVHSILVFKSTSVNNGIKKPNDKKQEIVDRHRQSH